MHVRREEHHACHLDLHRDRKCNKLAVQQGRANHFDPAPVQIDYPEIAESIMPRHRFMSAYEQRIEPPDRRWQYLLMAAEPYETIAFKVIAEWSFGKPEHSVENTIFGQGMKGRAESGLNRERMVGEACWSKAIQVRGEIKKLWGTHNPMDLDICFLVLNYSP